MALLQVATRGLCGGDCAVRPPVPCTTAAPSRVRTIPRVRRPGWLVVGSTGRNSGKTDLACTIIERFRRTHPVVGLKVTAVSDNESGCPRGGDGCGICASLAGDYLISEERGGPPGKDTTRMLEQGAHRVFWLRCRRQRMPAALEALTERLDPAALVVAESNSLAQAVEPDLFLMVRNVRIASVKPSAAAVMPLTDRVVACRDRAFDLDLRHLTAVDGVWRLMGASAAILAGGRSSRMGEDKSLLSIRGTPLIRHIHAQLAEQFDEVLISTNAPDKYAGMAARTVPDRVPGMGPLMGIASALEAARHERVFVTACDIPTIDHDTATRMLVLAEHADIVIPRSSVGHEPLFAVYRKRALPAMREALEAGERRISAVFPRVRTREFALGPAAWYRNLNTPEDVARFLREA